MTNIPQTPAAGKGAAPQASAPKATEAAVSITSATTSPATSSKIVAPAKATEPVQPASPAKPETPDAKAPKVAAKSETAEKNLKNSKSPKSPKRKYTKKAAVAAKSEPKARRKAAVKPKAATKLKAAPKAARKTAKKPIRAAVESPINTTVKGLEQASDAFEDGIRNFQQEWFGKAFEMGDLHIANVELHEIFESSRDATLHGITELNSEMKKFVEKNVEDGLSTGRDILKAKSVPEMIEIQSKAAQDNFQACLEHGRNLNAIAARTAHEAMEPVSGNWTETIEKFYKQMAL